MCTSCFQSVLVDCMARTGWQPIALGWKEMNSCIERHQQQSQSRQVFQAKLQSKCRTRSWRRQLYGASQLCMRSCRTYVNSWLCNMCQTHFVIFHIKNKSANRFPHQRRRTFQDPVHGLHEVRMLHHLQSISIYTRMHWNFSSRLIKPEHDTDSDTFQNMTTPVAGFLHTSQTNVHFGRVLELALMKSRYWIQIQTCPTFLHDLKIILQAKRMGQWNSTAKGLWWHAVVNPVPLVRGDELTHVSNVLHPMVRHIFLQERGFHAYQTVKQKRQEVPISFLKANQHNMQKAVMHSNINQSSRMSLHLLPWPYPAMTTFCGHCRILPWVHRLDNCPQQSAKKEVSAEFRTISASDRIKSDRRETTGDPSELKQTMHTLNVWMF